VRVNNFEVDRVTLVSEFILYSNDPDPGITDCFTSSFATGTPSTFTSDAIFPRSSIIAYFVKFWLPGELRASHHPIHKGTIRP
jgi:hypothetical protein